MSEKKWPYMGRFPTGPDSTDSDLKKKSILAEEVVLKEQLSMNLEIFLINGQIEKGTSLKVDYICWD